MKKADMVIIIQNRLRELNQDCLTWNEIMTRDMAKAGVTFEEALEQNIEYTFSSYINWSGYSDKYMAVRMLAKSMGIEVEVY